jgi:hypothetical protein
MTGYGLDGRVSIPGRGKRLFFSPVSKLALRPTQLPIQQVLGAASQAQSSQGVKLITLLHLVPKTRKVKLYVHSPICLHAVIVK